MKLIRYGAEGREKPGILLNDKKYDVSAFGEDYTEAFFETDGLNRLSAFLSENQGKLSQISDTERLGSPLARPSKLVCIGLNYSDHAKETNAPMPSEPVIFMKASSAIVGPFDDIVIPKNSKKTDWEVELAIVIGKKSKLCERG